MKINFHAKGFGVWLNPESLTEVLNARAK
jgi:hypothetical protein